MARSRPNRIGGRFVYKLVEMLESPAHRVLSLSALRVLDRILIEHANHGGKENGKLPVTYEQFVEFFGMDRHAIAPAIRELASLGFIEITERGYPGAGEFRKPNKFRLTFIPTKSADPTHEWRKIKTMESARMIAQTARPGNRSVKSTPPRTASNGNIKNKKPVGVNDHHGGGNPHRDGQVPMRKTLTTDPRWETPITSISRDD